MFNVTADEISSVAISDGSIFKHISPNDYLIINSNIATFNTKIRFNNVNIIKDSTIDLSALSSNYGNYLSALSAMSDFEWYYLHRVGLNEETVDVPTHYYNYEMPHELPYEMH